MGAAWKALVANITATLAVWLQLLQPQERIPHAEQLVVILWALLGGLALLITIMLRLWYRDFTEWKTGLARELKDLKEGQTRIREDLARETGIFETTKNDIHDRLERIEGLCDVRHHEHGIHRHKKKET